MPDAATILQRSFATWSTNTGAPAFTLATDGTVKRATKNGRNDILFASVTPKATAVTSTWTKRNDDVETDIVFNTRFEWRDLGPEGDGCYEDQPYLDLENGATHEFGHIYGLSNHTLGRFETLYNYV